MKHEQPLTIQQFAEALNICERLAREYARSETFLRLKISVDVALNEIKPKRKHGTGRRNKNYRIYMSRYEAARDRGLLAP